MVTPPAVNENGRDRDRRRRIVTGGVVERREAHRVDAALQGMERVACMVDGDLRVRRVVEQVTLPADHEAVPGGHTVGKRRAEIDRVRDPARSRSSELPPQRRSGSQDRSCRRSTGHPRPRRTFQSSPSRSVRRRSTCRRPVLSASSSFPASGCSRSRAGSHPSPGMRPLNGVRMSAPSPFPPNKPADGPGGTVVRGMNDARIGGLQLRHRDHAIEAVRDRPVRTGIGFFPPLVSNGTVVVEPAIAYATAPE